MKKYGKRIAAFALSLVVALGSVCYNPPKAEAVVVESAAAMAGAFTYLSATGFEFAGDGTAYGAMADAFEAIFTDWSQEYDTYVNEVSGYPDVAAPTLQETILSGMTLLENGFVKFSAAAANALGRFEDWLTVRFGLVDENGVVPDAVVPFVGGDGSMYLYNGVTLPDVYAIGETGPYVWIGYLSSKNVYRVSFCSTPYFMDLFGKNKVLSVYNTIGSTSVSYQLQDGVWVYNGSYTIPDDVGAGYLYGTGSDSWTLVWSNHDLIRRDTGNTVLAAEIPELSGEVLFNATLSSDYEAAPTVDEQYALVVNPGLTYADEQSFIDAVMNGVVAGTLAPTYTIEQAAAGDVVVPDEDEQENTQTGILSWTKKIWQSVQELPQTIAQAIADVFVPSVEYMETIPVTIADTFDDRTGFLTYPASLVYDFGDMLHEGQQDFVLRWPTVREPYSKGEIMQAGQFNVSQFVRDNDSVSTVYEIYQWVVKAYLTFLFLQLCKRKYNSVIGDRLGG